MKKKRSRIRRFAISLLIVFAVLMIPYLYLAHMPTGYRQLAEAQEQATEQAKDALKERLFSPPRKTANSDYATTPFLIAEAAPPPKELATEVIELLTHESVRSLHEYCIFPLDAGLHLPLEYFEQDTITGELQAGPEAQELIFARCRIELAGYRQSNKAAATELSPAAAQSLNRAIDRMEHLLLEAEWHVSGPLLADDAIVPYNMELIHATILRALIRGEEEKAVQLFRQYLDMLRLLQFYHFFNAIYVWEFLQSSYYFLGECDEFPAAELAWFADRLGQFSLSEEQFAPLVTLQAMQWKEEFLDELQMDWHLRPSYRRHDYSWDEDVDYYINTAIFKTLYPLAERQAELMAIGQAEGDLAAIIQAGKNIDRLTYCMPLESRPFTPYHNYREHFGDVELKKMAAEYAASDTKIINYPIDNKIALSRIILAAVEYRKTYGNYPAYLSDLAPRFISADFLEPINLPHEILDLEPFMQPVIEHYASGQSDTFSKAVRAYFAEHGEVPSEEGDLDDYVANDEELDTFTERFQEFEGVPVLVNYQRIPRRDYEKRMGSAADREGRARSFLDSDPVNAGAFSDDDAEVVPDIVFASFHFPSNLSACLKMDQFLRQVENLLD